MSVVRLQGRPKLGPSSVGISRIIADALDMIRRGERFTTRRDLAAKIGITPALLNYYFGKNNDFLEKSNQQLA